MSIYTCMYMYVERLGIEKNYTNIKGIEIHQEIASGVRTWGTLVTHSKGNYLKSLKTKTKIKQIKNRAFRNGLQDDSK